MLLSFFFVRIKELSLSFASVDKELVLMYGDIYSAALYLYSNPPVSFNVFPQTKLAVKCIRRREWNRSDKRFSKWFKRSGDMADIVAFEPHKLFANLILVHVTQL